jgi:hypothetical protein
LKLPIGFPRWLGCALANHETLAGGLIGAAGALFAAWLAWQAVMRQINAAADQAYEALRVELEPVVDMVNLYWRVVDASIRKKEWRSNGYALLRSLQPRPNELDRHISKGLVNRLDPVRQRDFNKVMEGLSWLSERMRLNFDDDEPLWFQNVRTMLSHFDVFLRKFDRIAARKFRWRKKGRLDHGSIAEQYEPLVAEFERTGKI